jgi:cobyrinic acid a,c-diamide synthase
LPILGALQRQQGITIPERHLGLVPTEELSQVRGILEQLADLAQANFDWEGLLPLLRTTPTSVSPQEFSFPQYKCRIAIARDRAFNFYYQDNLDLLERFGAELVPWSPLVDTNLPPHTQGLYLGGGFPETFCEQLAANSPAKQAVKTAIQARIPTYAECGGLMYLCNGIIDFANQAWDMVGVLPTQAVMSPRLTLGYRQGTVLPDTPWLRVGETVWGHEFHRSQLTQPPSDPLYCLQGYRDNSPTKAEGWYFPPLYASYLHLHWGEGLDIPRRFLSLCCP